MSADQNLLYGTSPCGWTSSAAKDNPGTPPVSPDSPGRPAAPAFSTPLGNLERTTMKKKADLNRAELTRLEQLPNIGPAIAADLRLLGVARPEDLVGRDPYALYEELGRLTRERHDPCLLDTFIAAVRFMNGGPARPWWKYTAQRKRELAARQKEGKSV